MTIGYQCEIELVSFLSSSGRDFPELFYSQNVSWEHEESARKRKMDEEVTT